MTTENPTEHERLEIVLGNRIDELEQRVAQLETLLSRRVEGIAQRLQRVEGRYEVSDRDLQNHLSDHWVEGQRR